MIFTQKDIDRFWAKVDTSGECWEWTAFRSVRGYGMVSFSIPETGKRPVLAHRIAYELAYGPIPNGLFICHRCDNPPCCNPAHLYAGTHQDNIKDATERKRMAQGDRHGWAKHPELIPRGDQHWAKRNPHKIRRGEQIGNARLTENDVRAIRKLKRDGVPVNAIAIQYGLHWRYVYKLVKGDAWGHVKDA